MRNAELASCIFFLIKSKDTPTAPEHVIDDKTSSDGTEQITSQKRFE